LDTGGSAGEGYEVELAQAVGVGEHVDLGDLSVLDGEGQKGDRSAVLGGEEAGVPVDEHGCHELAGGGSRRRRAG
jgi:hypothetical protein